MEILSSNLNCTLIMYLFSGGVVQKSKGVLGVKLRHLFSANAKIGFHFFYLLPTSVPLINHQI